MANIWSIRFVCLNLLISVQVFSPATNLKVLALAQVAKEKCTGKYQMGYEGKKNYSDADMKIKYFGFNRVPIKSNIENNGHTLKIELVYYDKLPEIEVDLRSTFGVVGRFRMAFSYFQWWKTMPEFSYYKNLTFPGELHVVFYDFNAGIYDDAIDLKRGIIVLSFRFKVAPLGDSFDFMKTNIKYIRKANSTVSFKNVNLNRWTKFNTSEFVAYEGSLLELPCQGTVIWIDYVSVGSIEPEMVKEFQKLRTNESNPLMEDASEMFEPEGEIFKTNKAKRNHFEMSSLIVGILFIFIFN